jgi:hypothetical protein
MGTDREATHVDRDMNNKFRLPLVQENIRIASASFQKGAWFYTRENSTKEIVQRRAKSYMKTQTRKSQGIDKRRACPVAVVLRGSPFDKQTSNQIPIELLSINSMSNLYN